MPALPSSPVHGSTCPALALCPKTCPALPPALCPRPLPALLQPSAHGPPCPSPSPLPTALPAFPQPSAHGPPCLSPALCPQSALPSPSTLSCHPNSRRPTTICILLCREDWMYTSLPIYSKGGHNHYLITVHTLAASSPLLLWTGDDTRRVL